MTEREDQEGGGDEESKNVAGEAKNELFAALNHLKNAAEILVGAADPAVRKAATEAERVLQKVGADAEPIARQLGAELGKMTRTIVDAIEGRKKSEPPRDESEVERLEREAKDAAQKK